MHLDIYVTITIIEREAINLRGSMDEYLEGVQGRKGMGRNDVITLFLKIK